MARGRARPLLGMLLGHCMWLAPACAQQVTQCTDIDVGAAQLSKHRAFGGIEFCCRESATCDDKFCCPGDGSNYTGTLAANTCCESTEVELLKTGFLEENKCPACLQDGTCSPKLQLDNIQTQGPQVRSE